MLVSYSFAVTVPWLTAKMDCLHDNFGFLLPFRYLNTTSMYCDCQVDWFADWVRESELIRDVAATCSHPESLLGNDIFQLEKSQFVCGKLQSQNITSVRPNASLTSLTPGSFFVLYCSKQNAPGTEAQRQLAVSRYWVFHRPLLLPAIFK